MVSFQHIVFFFAFLSLLIPSAFFILALYRKGKIKRQLGDSILISQLTQSYSHKLVTLKFLLTLLALGLLIVAAANLRRSVGESNLKEGIDIMIALDVSNSMLSTDIQPSRLEASKRLVQNIISGLGDNRIGIVVFAGKPFLQLPVTTDLSSAEMYISSINTDAAPDQGTAIGNALQLCDISLELHEKKHKAVVLISDGETHDNTAIAMAKRLHDHGVVVYCIGAGTQQGSSFIVEGATEYMKDDNSKIVVSKLNELLLKDIADITGGKYFMLDNPDILASEVMKELTDLDKKAYGSESAADYLSFYQLFLLAGIILLVIEIFIPEVKGRIKAV